MLPSINVAEKERVASVMGGAAILGYGLYLRSGVTPLFALLGGLLIRRGLTGRCSAYRRMGVDTTKPKCDSGVQDGEGSRVEKAIAIDRTPTEVYEFWRDLENLPKFMPHLKSVKVLSPHVSHWIVEGPTGLLEWDAEIINEHPGSMLAWQTMPGADVQSAGTVRFEPLDGGQRTKVTVVLKFDPPAGALGEIVAKIFGESPDQQLEEDLGRFKVLLETNPVMETMNQG